MDKVLLLFFIVIFFGMLIITFKVLIDSKFNSFFKQGKIVSIRVAYAIIMIVVSTITAYGITKIIECFYNLLS